MTFRSNHDQWGTVFAHLPDLGCGRSWEDVHRVRPLAPLTCDECRHPMNAKLSPTGLRFFAHLPGAPDCAAAGESLAHHLLKLELSTAARDAGAHAEMEVRGPEGRWRADVMASAPGGGWRIALEAQLSPIAEDDLRARTDRMHADGVRSVWFSDRAEPPWLGAVPSVRLARQDGVLTVAEGLTRFDRGVWEEAPAVPVAEFFRWLFTGRVVPHTRRAPSAYGMRPMRYVWTAPRYVREEAALLAGQERQQAAREVKSAADRQERERRERREAELRARTIAASGSAEGRRKARQAANQKRARRVMAQQEREARSRRSNRPRLGNRQHIADHVTAVLARDRGLVSEVGWTTGDDRYAGGIPLVGNDGMPVAVIDPDPGQTGTRAVQLLAGLRLVFTSEDLRAAFLATAAPPAPEAGDGYWTITVDVPSAPLTRPRNRPERPLAASPVIAQAPASYVPPQPRHRPAPPPPKPSCACPTPRLTVAFPHGVEDVEPCTDLTPSSALLTAECRGCGGWYDGPWRRNHGRSLHPDEDQAPAGSGGPRGPGAAG